MKNPSNSVSLILGLMLMGLSYALTHFGGFSENIGDFLIGLGLVFVLYELVVRFRASE